MTASDAKVGLATLPRALAVPGLELVRGRIVGRCPERLPGQEQSCWKLENPDETARFDFWFLVTMLKQRGRMLVNKWIPIANGEVLFLIRTLAYRQVVENRYVSTLKSTCHNFGALRVERATARVFYEGFTRTLFDAEYRILRCDPNLRPIEELDASTFTFPPLPAGAPAGPADPVPSRSCLLDLLAAEPRGCLYFPEWETDADGELIVDGGDEYPLARGPAGRPLLEVAAGRPPGLYADLVEKTSDPALIGTLFTLVEPPEPERLLFGTWCTQVSSHEASEHIFRKVKKRWWRKRIKVTELRRVLAVDDTRCDDAP